MNLSKEELKKLDIPEGEIFQYVEEGVWDLALQVVGWRGHLIEYTKGTDRLYPKETPAAIKLIRQLEKEKHFDMIEVKRELENRLEKIKKTRPQIKPVKK